MKILIQKWYNLSIIFNVNTMRLDMFQRWLNVQSGVKVTIKWTMKQ
jgi:hypothetical protein